MGLIKAGLGAVGGVLADQWVELYYCESLPSRVLVKRGEKQVSSNSSNTKGHANVISNGSGIAVADGQCMILTDQGKVIEVCAEPGVFTYNDSTEPSVFTGELTDSIKESFKTIGKRMAFGGDTGKDQRVYYVNTKEIMNNNFGCRNSFLFDVVNKKMNYKRTIQVSCRGVYSFKIVNPLVFYKNVSGNVLHEYRTFDVVQQMRDEISDALQPAFAKLSELELRPSQIPAHTQELKDALNEVLKELWIEYRGIKLESIALNPLVLPYDDMVSVNKLEDALANGLAPSVMAGRMIDATFKAVQIASENATANTTGAVAVTLATNTNNSWKCQCGATTNGKFCRECGTKRPEAEEWKCTCGAINKGKFCQECGTKRNDIRATYKCDKCGYIPPDPLNPPKFCPECGDAFNNNDVN